MRGLKYLGTLVSNLKSISKLEMILVAFIDGSLIHLAIQSAIREVKYFHSGPAIWALYILVMLTLILAVPLCVSFFKSDGLSIEWVKGKDYQTNAMVSKFLSWFILICGSALTAWYWYKL